jgi:hypothetical protein
MQTATGFTTQDATAPTPNLSPLPYLTTVITLAVPDTALRLILIPSTTLRVSEDPEMARYCLVAAGTEAMFDVAALENVYVRQYASPGTVNFRFATLRD